MDVFEYTENFFFATKIDETCQRIILSKTSRRVGREKKEEIHRE